MTGRPLLLITGASRGIGAGLALAAAGRGYDLVLTARSLSPQLTDVADRARAAGASVDLVPLALGSPASVAALAATVSDRRFSGLINNAAHVGARGPLADQDVEDLAEVLAVNVQGTILVTRAMIPLIEPGGAIIMMSSQSAQFGGNGLSAYAASKAALTGLTISLGRELAPAGIRVVAVSPGPVLTEPLLALPPARLQEMQASLPMGRFCAVEDVAATVLWLMSAEAGYISGAVVPVHGAR
ncbi:MAG: SDR family oxidoreductase [Alphaproteobacteria bacterium]|nr:SDR family oxidoreductase [Alphaproteobacteria bacterium]TAD89377.1 MAG: SDR family oxidoreductase [Alphaproteobacteria bacterium]